jgi:hypothetical protein
VAENGTNIKFKTKWNVPETTTYEIEAPRTPWMKVKKYQAG